MIRKQHSRFIRNSFLAVCSILVVIFLIITVMMVRFVDTSIENELVSLIHFTNGGVENEQEKPQDENGENPEEEKENLATRLGLEGPRNATVGGTRFPTYLFQILQGEPDPKTVMLMPGDQIVQIRGERYFVDDEESWRVLLDEMLKSTKRIDRIESEEFCYMVNPDLERP